MKYEFNTPPAVVTYGKAGKAKYFAKLFKVSAADEVADVYTLHRTHLVAGSATRTLFVINGSKVINNLNCTLGTGLFTLSAGDTAVKANLTHLSTLVVTRALNDNTRGVVDKMDNVIRTSLGTKSAANALSGVNLGNSLFGIDADCISGANLHTVAVAKAGEGTVTVTRIGHICRGTGLDTVVDVLSLGGVAGAVAGNVCYLLNHVTGRKTHYLTDFSSNTVTTGNTEAGVVGLALGESLCISVTAGETASTAVSAGKTVTNSKSAFVLLNRKEDR